MKRNTELSSRRLSPPEREKKSQKELDFGTYHHSTPEDLRMIRTLAKTMFAEAFTSVPQGDELKILDVGCDSGS
jgi:hypothetical protein